MSRRINVLELRSVRGTGGGPEKTILLGAARAARDEFDVTVCYIRDRRDEVFRLDERAGALDITYVEAYEQHSLDVRIWPQLRRLVRGRRIDVVHAHEYKTDLLAWLLARRTGAAALATAHGWTGQSPRERRLYYPIDKRLLARFPRVIAVSTDIKNDLVRHGAKPERVSVILNAIDPVAYRRTDSGVRDRLRGQMDLGAGDIAIGAVGRLERQKRFDLLLEAFAALAPRHAALRLVIAGDGSLRFDLEGLATELGVAGQCRFLGHRSDIADLHHAFDLFVQSAEYEGTPNAVLEAMAMETPIVATDVGGTSELARANEHALIVPAHDVPALVGAIEQALADPEASARRVLAARRRVETELSFESRTRHLESIYRELVTSRNGRSYA